MSTQDSAAAEMPPGWAKATVGDIAEYINGLAFKPSDWQSEGRPIIRIQNLTRQNDRLNRTMRKVHPVYVVQHGTILVSWSATLDVFVWHGPEAVLNQHIFKVVPVGALSDHSFVRWALKNAIDEMWRGEHTHGTTMRHINRAPFLAHRLPLPPVGEQTRIAEAIDSYLSRLDNAVASLERAHAKLKSYRASVLKAAVEGRLVPTEATLARAEERDYQRADALLARILEERRRRWEEAEHAKFKAAGKPPKDDKWKASYGEPIAPDTTTLPTLPEGWCWASLGLMKEFSLYGPRFSSDDYTGDGVLVLRTSDISETGRVNLETPPRLRLTTVEFEKYQAKKGDLLITRTGSLGTLAVLNDDVAAIPGAYLIQYRLAAPPETVWYCFYFLRSPNAQGQLIGGGQGVGRPNLNAPTIDSIPVALPPLREQVRIVEEIQRFTSLADNMLVQAQTSASRCVRLRQAVLKWAFEGKLVDQDPADEPAARLLARIRAQRLASVGPTTKKSRGRKVKGAG